MILLILLRVLICAGIAYAIGYYALQGIRNGKILIGVRFYETRRLESWADRRVTPELFWFVVAALFAGAAICLAFGFAPLWNGK